jgi:hypothetical protein
MNDRPTSPNPAASPPDRASTYAELLAAEAGKLDATLAAIRADTEAGNLTSAEAADNRVQVLEAHLASIRLLRELYLGGDDA